MIKYNFLMSNNDFKIVNISDMCCNECMHAVTLNTNEIIIMSGQEIYNKIIDGTISLHIAYDFCIHFLNY